MEAQIEDTDIKNILKDSKTIAMVGVSSEIKNEDPQNIVRRPSRIVMKYMQKFGYKVIPVNPRAAGEEIYGEKFVGKLEDIKEKIDIVDVFRPSKEAANLADQAKKIGAKVLWLQYGIHSEEAKKIADEANMKYVSNRCIKQDYQLIFQKKHPVFPALKKTV